VINSADLVRAVIKRCEITAGVG